VAVASAGAYANHLHFIPDRKLCQHLITQFFTGWILFLSLLNLQSSPESNVFLQKKSSMMTAKNLTRESYMPFVDSWDKLMR